MLYEGVPAREMAEELMNSPAAKREIEIMTGTGTGQAAILLEKLRSVAASASSDV